MIFIDCQQGSPEWLQARAGVITASRFADAISTVGGLTEQQQKYVESILGGSDEKDAIKIAGYKAKPSASAIDMALRGENPARPSDVSRKYACDLALERISGKPYGEPARAWTLERGHELEALARMQYEAETGELVYESGIVLTDDRLFAYSTDGAVGNEGLIEVKAPIDSLKIEAMLATGDVSEYEHQMQGGMWITGRKWCDLLMPIPDLNYLFKKRVMRDDDFIDRMVKQLLVFANHVSEKEAFFKLKAA